MTYTDSNPFKSMFIILTMMEARKSSLINLKFHISGECGRKTALKLQIVCSRTNNSSNYSDNSLIEGYAQKCNCDYLLNGVVALLAVLN